jgi:two-component system, OmpR family, phosphate regulon sensor histidine kinase PhoR
MNRTIKKIGLILLLIILFPAAFLIVYEITSLNQNEEVLETIYTSQLDAILFSVNQYSEDVVRSYAARINSITGSGKEDSSNLKEALKESEALVYAAVTDTIPPEKITDVNFENGNNDFRKDFLDVLAANNEKITRLYTYYRGGFQKFEPVMYNGYIHLLFISNSKLCGFILKPELFINQVLAPRIQSVAQDQFILRIIQDNKILYSTAEDAREVHLNRPLWLAPAYTLGILLRGTTIDELVNERFYTNVIIISVLAVILILGVWVVFRNIKREIELAQIKSDFVSNVSHELRTPLALISMFAETLDMGRVRTEEKKKEYFKIISQETNRLSRIVNKILNFSRMEAGKRVYSIMENDINEITSGVYETYRFHLQNNGFKSSFIPADNLPPVKIDSEAYSEALINLIDNAMKYSEDVKEVNILTGSENGFVYVEVNDKGVGISDENQKKIFDKFFRVTSGLVHNTKGTGLGLTLVKHIMDAHKGKIELNSRLWEGSSFKLKFPLNKNSR